MSRVIHFHHRRPRPLAALPTQLEKIERHVVIKSWWQRPVVIYSIVVALMILIALVGIARAGGPQFVAGVSYFDASVAGQPITWAGGTVNYYSDQGDLSTILPGASADSFVADAFSRWTSIPTAAVTATRAGQLAQDVNGSNVILNADRTISLPADIQPTATDKPLAIVYDVDGQVTDALLGSGASADCFDNSAFGGADAFTNDGHFAHALVILDGKCALTSAALPDLKYRLVRVLGQILGLGWAQANLNVITGSPRPTSNDYAGFPLMHAQDSLVCTPIALCYPNADQPKMDDRAALGRLYPVTSQNLAQFPGKQVTATTTGRIHGSVFFTDGNGNPAQPMQGVNVVARWIDPSSGQPSGKNVATCVSGFLFTGNSGNPVTGYTDGLGQPYNRFGATDPALEGYFDLAGLEIPNGGSAQYQLSIEALNPDQSARVGPYAPSQVQPSGSFQPVIVTLIAGSDVPQDILMSGSASANNPTGMGTFSAPLPLPRSGEWAGTIGDCGSSHYFSIPAKENRTLVLQLTALDESNAPTTLKAQPVLGIWSMAVPEGTPATVSSLPFNSVTSGMTQLNAQLLSTTQFRLGIADLRGDGRPDFRYRAHILYADSAIPNRISARGSPVLVDGIGFRPDTKVKIGNVTTTVLGSSPDQLVVSVPQLPDSTQDLSVTDPTTGAASVITGALTVGAGPNDSIRLVQSGNSPTPVGVDAANPIRIAVTSPDGTTAINGATVQWSSTSGAGLSACNGATTCSVLTDESGQSETRVTLAATGTTTITATLAPASYTPYKSVQATVSGTSSAKDLALLTPKVWVVQGATVDVPFAARLLNNGAPLSGQTLNWFINLGSGSMSPSSGTTDGNGYGRSTLHLSSLAADVQGSVCLAPTNNPCQTFYIVQVQPAALKLQPVSGGLQTILVGQSFLPITLRITNSATPANPVMGVTVNFQSMTFLPDNDAPVETSGDDGSSQHAMKVLLSSTQSSAVTDINGLVSLQPSTGGLMRPLEIEIAATTPNGGLLQYELPMLQAPSPPTGQSTGIPRTPARTNPGFIRKVIARQGFKRTPREPSPSGNAVRPNAIVVIPSLVAPDATASPECSTPAASPSQNPNPLPCRCSERTSEDCDR